jgi:hypothetical protein
MAHVQSNRWGGTQGASPEAFLGAFAADGVGVASTSRALAPARGALLGSVLGAACWGLLLALVWMAF